MNNARRKPEQGLIPAGPNAMTKLTRNQRRVLEILQQAEAPLGAYAILKKAGFRGATQVYRALEKLTGLGLAKKLESLHAFVAVSEERQSASTAFAICDQCGHIHEVADAGMIESLHEQLARSNFQVGRTVIEFHGACSSCCRNVVENEEPNTSSKPERA